jgi:hypothetical protein
MTEDDRSVEAEERIAIRREAEIAARQTIPQETMVAGLLAVVWPRTGGGMNVAGERTQP